MLDLAGGTTVYLACGATDLRKSYHGLAVIIKLKFKLDPYSRCKFAFCNRRRTSIKILQWNGSGFWILMKRLDRDSFLCAFIIVRSNLQYALRKSCSGYW